MTSYGYRCVLLRWNSPPTDPAMQAKKTRLKKSARCNISVGPVVVLVVQLVAIESNNKTCLNPWVVQNIRIITPMTGSLNACFLVVDVQASKTKKYKQRRFSIWLAVVPLFTEWANTQNAVLISMFASLSKVIAGLKEISNYNSSFSFLEFTGASLFLHVSTGISEKVNICYQVP